MKQYICTALALLMAATLFVGCGCTNRNVSDHPGGMITDPTDRTPTTNPMPTMTTPTQETTRPTTAPTRETTMPTTAATTPSDYTGDTGSTAATDTTDTTGGETTESARSRAVRPQRMP